MKTLTIKADVKIIDEFDRLRKKLLETKYKIYSNTYLSDMLLKEMIRLHNGIWIDEEITDIKRLCLYVEDYSYKLWMATVWRNKKRPDRVQVRSTQLLKIGIKIMQTAIAEMEAKRCQ
jgi:nucleoside-triphosphatase THEP1